MVNVYTFDFSEFSYDYVCMNQNSVTHRIQDSGSWLVERTDITALMTGFQDFDEVLDALNKLHSKRLLIWDMRRVEIGPIHDLNKVLAPFDKGIYDGICFLMDCVSSSVYKRIDSALKGYITDNPTKGERAKVGSSALFYGDKTALEGLQNHKGERGINSVVDNDINRHVFQWFRTDENWVENPSSNVYVNRYFDAKKILANGGILNLVIYRMALMIQDGMKLFAESGTNTNRFDAFVCASLTGACIAAGLSAVFHKPVVFLKNVGPCVMVNDGKMIERIKKGKRYIFIYDFMCMGKEYERINMICDLRAASLVLCAGISYYRLPRFQNADKKTRLENYRFDWNKELKISSLFNVNAFEGKDDYYRCEVRMVKGRKQ